MQQSYLILIALKNVLRVIFVIILILNCVYFSKNSFFEWLLHDRLTMLVPYKQIKYQNKFHLHSVVLFKPILVL